MADSGPVFDTLGEIYASDDVGFVHLIKIAGLEKSIDLKGADLSDLDLSNQDLSGADFTNSDLSGCRFINSNLEKAIFDGADLHNVDLTGANLDGATFRGAILRNANLSGVKYKSVDIEGADIFGAIFDEDISEIAKISDVLANSLGTATTPPDIILTKSVAASILEFTRNTDQAIFDINRMEDFRVILAKQEFSETITLASSISWEDVTTLAEDYGFDQTEIHHLKMAIVVLDSIRREHASLVAQNQRNRQEEEEEEAGDSSDEDEDGNTIKIVDVIVERYTYLPEMTQLYETKIALNSTLAKSIWIAKTAKQKFTEMFSIFKHRVKKVADLMGVNSVLVVITNVADRNKIFRVSLKLFGTAIIPALAIAGIAWTFMKFLQNPFHTMGRWFARELKMGKASDDSE